MSESNGNGEKALDTTAIRRSVIERPPIPDANSPAVTYDNTGIVWMLANYADGITAWGPGYRQRDVQLRNFIMKESIFAASLGIVCARNAGFSWRLNGPVKTVERMQDVLENADAGEGWDDLIFKLSIDLYTQDNAAFGEIVREEDDERAPIIGFNHLDSARCQHTRNPEYPVIYQDINGKLHRMPWYSVITLAEMPVPIENLQGLQYCALSRMLADAQIQRNLKILKEEKTGGRETKVIHLLQGITTLQVQDAINKVQAFNDSQGYMRYSSPVTIGTLDPNASIDHKRIDLASMPEGFSEELNFNHYINLIAMAFASDYQEFAPLPGNGLGTSTQSEMLHLKARGKGPGRFMKLISHAINFRILPKNVQFEWAEQDLEAQKLDAEVRAIRAQTRATRIGSLEITPQVARQIANDEGDLGQEYLDMMAEADLTENVMADDDTQASAQTQDLGKPIKPINVRRPDPNLASSRTPNPTANRPRQPQQRPA